MGVGLQLLANDEDKFFLLRKLSNDINLSLSSVRH